MFSNSRGDSMRPTRRMLWSSSGPFTSPTGAVVFCRRSAPTTSATDTLYSRSFCARSSTDSSRFSEPFTSTVDTPLMPRNRSASWSSASREISASVCVLEDSPSCITGSCEGSARNRIGSRISSGSLCRTWLMALRISSAASIMFFLKSKMTMICAWPSEAVERISLTLRHALQRLLDAVDDLALDRLRATRPDTAPPPPAPAPARREWSSRAGS
jgi:hypothetical protein